MIFFIECVCFCKFIIWLIIFGVLLLFVVVGGIFVMVLQNLIERFEFMIVVIVNFDEFVIIDGQMILFGCQFVVGFVDGLDDFDLNLMWVIFNEDDVVDGLVDGFYQVVIMIFEDFFVVVILVGMVIFDGGGKVEQVIIIVIIFDDGFVVDDFIIGQIVDVVVLIMGMMFFEVMMENILVGFIMIGDQIGDVVDGVLKFVNGVCDVVIGVVVIFDGVIQFVLGVGEFSFGVLLLVLGFDMIVGKMWEVVVGVVQIGLGFMGGGVMLQQNVGGIQQFVGVIQSVFVLVQFVVVGFVGFVQQFGGFVVVVCILLVVDQV